jgi:hypothetical protein
LFVIEADMAEESELVLIDEAFINKIDELLDTDKNIQMKVQVGLILALQSQQAKSTNALVRHVKTQNGKVFKSEQDIADLKKKNIVNWTTEHTKTAVTILIIFILLVDIIVDRFSSIDIIMALTLFFRKWLGI